MPVPWRTPKEPEYHADTPTRYDVLKVAAYDDGAKRQGTLLVGVIRQGRSEKDGKSFEGTFLGASDDSISPVSPQCWRMSGVLGPRLCGPH
jgi:hypothetical protein